MTIDPVAVIVMGAWKSNHLPRREIFVTAIDWIGKKAVLRVGEDLDEELFAVDAVKPERSHFQSVDHLILLDVGQICEDFAAELLAARRVQRSQCFTIALRGGGGGLWALLLGPVLERSHHVVGFVAAVWTGKLAVDEHRTTAIFSAGCFRIGGNQTIDKGFDRGSLLRREKMPTAWLGKRGRV